MKKINKILIIRFRRVGDAVISTVLCSSLKKSFPKATIDYVLNEGIAPLFENHPDIDRLITFSQEEMADLRKYVPRVRQIMNTENYDLIVDTRSTIQTLWFCLFSLHTPYRLGCKKNYNALLHNYRTNNKGLVDEVNKTLSLLHPLEKYFNISYEKNFSVYVSDKEKEAFAQYMQKQGVIFSKPIIICAVTARLSHKIWDKDRMKEILWKMIELYDAQLIFNYGNAEEMKFAIQLQAEMGNTHPNIFAKIEATDLRQLAAMIANSNFFFGNEGGPRHISQALNIPSFAIYPPNINKKEWLPNACERFQGIEPADILEEEALAQLSYKEKFEIITVDTVWKELQPMLQKYIQ